MLARLLLPRIAAFLEENRTVHFSDEPQAAKLLDRALLAPFLIFLKTEKTPGLLRLEAILRQNFPFYEEWIAATRETLIGKILARSARGKMPERDADLFFGVDAASRKTFQERLDDQNRQLQSLDVFVWSMGGATGIRLYFEEPRLDKEILPSRLLHPFRAFIPLIGREREMEILEQWREEETLFSWSAVTGEGGVGKTRLALEFTKKSIFKNWHGGFLGVESLDLLVHRPEFPRWQPLTDTLVVVDYAASKLNNLKQFLARCHDWTQEIARERPPRPPRLRLLLLERHADPQFGWLPLLSEAENEARRRFLRATLRTTLELHPPGQHRPYATMMETLHAVFQNWSALHKKSPVPTPAFTEDALRELRRRTGGRPLFLQLAAVHACTTGAPQSLPEWKSADLLEHAVADERRFIRSRVAPARLQPLVERLLALLFFLGPTSARAPAWREIVANESAAIKLPAADAERELAQLVGETDALGNTLLLPIYPDPVGAAFSVKILEEIPDAVQASLTGVIDAGGLFAWGKLMRSAQDLRERGGETIDSWLKPLLPSRPIEELLNVEIQLPEKIPSLAQMAVSLTETLKIFSQDDLELAHHSNNLGNRYAVLNKQNEAHAAALEAVLIYVANLENTLEAAQELKVDIAALLDRMKTRLRTLSAKDEFLAVAGFLDPQTRAPVTSTAKTQTLILRLQDALERVRGYAPDPEQRLRNLPAIHNLLGRLESGFHSCKTALDILDRLAPGSAVGLRRSAKEESEDKTDALERLAELIKIVRRLEPQLASALLSLSQRQTALDKSEEALGTAKHAVEIHRHLAQSDAALFLPDLAHSLENLAGRLTATARHDAAVKARQQSVEIFRALANEHPQRFRSAWANGLAGLGEIHLTLEKSEAALAAVQQAADIYRELAHLQPDAFEPPWAACLQRLGQIHRLLDNRAKALSATREAARVYERLAQIDPEKHDGTFAVCLGFLAERFAALGKREEAWRAQSRGVAILDRWVTDNPYRYETPLANGLNRLGRYALELGNPVAALKIMTRARDLLKRLVFFDPETHTPLFSACLEIMRDCLAAAGKRDEALAAALEGIQVSQPTGSAEERLRFAKNLADTSRRLSRQDQLAEALATAQQAVDVTATLAEENPDRYQAVLAEFLLVLGDRHFALGQTPEAIAAVQRSAETYARLARIAPDLFLAEAAKSHGSLGNFLFHAGRIAEAHEIFRQAVQDLQPGFRTLPHAYADTMADLIACYLKTCDRLEKDAETRLIGPLVLRLKQLQSPATPG